jgi:hypothetical protein
VINLSQKAIAQCIKVILNYNLTNEKCKKNHNILKDAGGQRKVRYNLQNGLLISLYNTLNKTNHSAHKDLLGFKTYALSNLKKLVK